MDTPLKEIKPGDLLGVLREIEQRGAHETAHKIKGTCGQIFRFAIGTDRAERDITADLRGLLKPVNQKHFASITDPKQIGALMRTIQDYDGYIVTVCALQLAPLVFVRPGELRHAEWSEFHFDQQEWHISAHKMKMKKKHIVPLSTQALEILRRLEPVTGGGKYVFPSIRTNERPMSENTVNGALRRLGYSKEEFTGHGFRSMASTRLNEAGFNIDWIELQLAHSEGNSVRAAYNYAMHLKDRKNMMQFYSDYLYKLRDGAEIIPFKKIS